MSPKATLTLHVANATEPCAATAGGHRIVASCACADPRLAKKIASILSEALPSQDEPSIETLEVGETEVLVMGEVHTQRGSWHLGWTRPKDLPEAFGNQWPEVEEVFARFKLPNRSRGGLGNTKYILRSETAETLASSSPLHHIIADTGETQPRLDPPDTLVVDDDETTLAFCKGVFETAGHRVDTTTTDYEAKTLLAKKHYDIILLDIHLKNASGIDLCHHLRNPENPIYNPSVWIIAFTSDTSAKTLLTMLAAGANDYVTKPATPEQLWVKATVAKFAQPRMWALKKRNALLEKELERMAKFAPSGSNQKR